MAELLSIRWVGKEDCNRDILIQLITFGAIFRDALYFLFVAYLLFLCGCSNFVRSNVSIFHDFDKPVPLKTIKVRPFNPSLENSLEFKSYRNRISNKLAENGFRVVPKDKPSELVALISYGIDQGKVASTSTPIYGQNGGGTTFTQGTVTGSGGGFASYSGTSYTMPTYGVVGSQTSSSTLYTRNLALDIVESSTLSEKNVNVLFEGRVKSTGICSHVSSVMPHMVESLFKNFPGKSGKTYRVELPWDGKC